MALGIATYNVHRCVGRDRRHDPGRTLAVLGELDAHVIALQEIEWRPEEALHVLAEFGHHLGCETLAGPTLFRTDGHYGNALLTRLPVREVSRMDLTLPGCEPRGALDVRLDAGNGACLRVLATHLGLRPAERRAQVRALLRRLDVDPCTHTVLLGDVNEWFLWGRPLRWLHRRLGRPAAPATFPSFRPLFALDRIWASPAARLSGLRVHASPLARVASDHLPLTAWLDPAPEAGAAPGQADPPSEGVASTGTSPQRRDGGGQRVASFRARPDRV